MAYEWDDGAQPPGPDPLPCLWCGAGLVDQGANTVTCEKCKVVYAAEIVREAEREVWLQALRREGFSVTRHDGELIVTKEN